MGRCKKMEDNKPCLRCLLKHEYKLFKIKYKGYTYKHIS